MPNLQIRTHAKYHPGRGSPSHKTNEDYAVSSDTFIAVADGVSPPQPGGEKASILALDTLSQLWQYSPPADCSNEGIEHWFARSFNQCRGAIVETAKHDKKLAGMTTTLAAAVYVDGTVYIANLGRCRALLFRDKRHKWLTNDHTVANNLLRSGQIRSSELKKHREYNTISRFITTDPSQHFEPEITSIKVQSNDIILLCSDGLHQCVPEEKIAEALFKHIADHLSKHQGDPEFACYQMQELALAAGAPDNLALAAMCFS